MYRIGEVSSENFFGMASKMVKFGTTKFEEVLKVYEKRGSQIQSLENNVYQMEMKLGKRKV